jgi:hypothetical protein
MVVERPPVFPEVPMDEQTIQCPTCSKRYRLKGNPPPTFTCKGCGTVMDLSGFRQPEPAAAPAVSTTRAGGSRGARSSSRASDAGPAPSRRHGRRAGSAPRARSRRGAAPDVDEDEGGPHYVRHQKQGPDTRLVIASAAVLVVALIALLLFTNAQSKENEKRAAEEAAKQEKLHQDQQSASALLAAAQNALPSVEQTAKIPPPVQDKPDKKKEIENARPELAKGSLTSLPAPEGKENYLPSQAKITTYDYPDYVTAEEKNEIEKNVEKMIQESGRDADDARAYLIALDKYPQEGSKFKAVGRLVSEFKKLMDTENMDDPMTKAKFMILDKALRQIDGVMERDFKSLDALNINSTPRQIEIAAKRWNWWYDLEKWRLRREPWDPKKDMLDNPAVEEGLGDE